LDGEREADVIVVRQMCGALIVAVVSLLFVTPESAVAEAAENVSLQFKWPSPVALRVERSFERLERRPDGSVLPPVRSTTRFVWRGAEAGTRYKVAFSDFEVVRAEPKPQSTDALVQLEYISRSVEPLLPTLVVDAAGQPVDLEGLPELRERIASQYRSIRGLNQDEQAQQMVAVLTSDQLLAQRALEDWNRMVQVWNGVSAELGATKEVEGETGGAAGTPVRNVFSYSVERRVPCENAKGAASCVRVVVSQTPRFDDARAASRTLLGFDFVTAFGAPPAARLELRNTFSTVTHPETLLPVRYEKEKRWSVSWEGETGNERVVGRTDRWDYQFTPIK
jgi:hypothetical protein